jgi:hypothetical protein
VLYCEPCDKEFNKKSAYEAHLATHEKCQHAGCAFVGSKKVVGAHFQSSHGAFSGSGYKMIDVEGQKFRVLLGSNPEEIVQWRAERKNKFPSVLNHRKEKADSNVGLEVSHKRVQGNDDEESNLPRKAMRKNDGDAEGDEGTGGDRRASFPCKFNYKNKKCSKGDTCPYSHTAAPLLCKRFSSTGRCLKGNSCMFVHDKKAARETTAGETGTLRGKAKGRLHLPDPAKGSLLRRLLDKDIRAEESLILQALDYLHRRNFLL